MTNNFVSRIERVSHRYGKTLALNDLTLDIPANCMVGMIRARRRRQVHLAGAHLPGFAEIQTGKVRVLDGDMADEHHRRASYGRIAYMPQGLGRNLYPTLSVYDNIDFFRAPLRPGRSRAARTHRRASESHRALPVSGSTVREAVGGMKQKVSLCCSLMHDPDLLVLDEPTTGVDPLSRRQFWELINSIRARRPMMSVIVATAYMDEASRSTGSPQWTTARSSRTVRRRRSSAKAQGHARRRLYSASPARKERPAPGGRRASTRRGRGQDAGNRGGRGFTTGSAISSPSTM